MALNQDYVGKVYPPGPAYLVGREKVREFATAIGEHNPACHDVAHEASLGRPDVVAPPTYAIVIAMQALDTAILDPGLGLDYSRVVHAEQRFAYTRPLRAGDSVVTTTTIESARVVAGNDMLTTRSDIATESGEPICSCWNVLLARAAGEES